MQHGKNTFQNIHSEHLFLNQNLSLISARTSDFEIGTVDVTNGVNADLKGVTKQNKLATLRIHGVATQTLYSNGTAHFKTSIIPIGYIYVPYYIQADSGSKVMLAAIDANGNITLVGGNINSGENFLFYVQYSCQ